MPIIVRGDGCYLEDSNGKRYLDALAGLFSVNIGYGYGEEVGQAAHEQMRELPFYTNWSLRPSARDRARRRGRGARARRPEPASSSSPAAPRRSSRRGSSRASTTPPAASRRWKAISRRCRVPRDDDGRALDQRHPRAAGAVRAARAGGAARRATRTATTGRPTRPRRSSPRSCSTSSSRPSPRRARDASAW